MRAGAVNDVLGPLRGGLRTTALYAASARRVLRRNGRGRGGTKAEERLVFVVGSPRSGTTFLAGAIGGLPGFVDLTEVTPLKARIPELAGLPVEESAVHVRRILERVRRLAFVRRLRGVEQTPEMAFLAAAALYAYPDGRVVHLVRDGRDVACSLLERGWLSDRRSGADDARIAYGARARFWVEPERRDEFAAASDATRAAWAWCAYVTAARRESSALEVRYEALVADRAGAAERLGAFLDVEPGFVAERLAPAHGSSIGRWQRDLTPAQLADVEREAGPLLTELGYRI